MRIESRNKSAGVSSKSVAEAPDATAAPFKLLDGDERIKSNIDRWLRTGDTLLASVPSIARTAAALLFETEGLRLVACVAAASPCGDTCGSDGCC